MSKGFQVVMWELPEERVALGALPDLAPARRELGGVVGGGATRLTWRAWRRSCRSARRDDRHLGRGHLGARRAAGGLAERGLAGVADDGLGSTGAHGQSVPARGRQVVSPPPLSRAAARGGAACAARRTDRQFLLELFVWRSGCDYTCVLATRLLVTVARSVYKCSQTGVLLGFDNSLRGYGAFTLLAATF